MGAIPMVAIAVRIKDCETSPTIEPMKDLQDLETQAYERGRRIARMNDLTEDELRSHYQYESRILTMMRESAGYENTKHIAPTQSVGYQSDQYRKETEGSKERYEAMKEAFWDGFADGRKEIMQGLP